MADDSTAPCPICKKSVPFEAINSHLDICLIPGGSELHRELLPSRSSEGNSASTSTPLPVTSQPHTVQSTLLGKRTSPTRSPTTSKKFFTTSKEAHQSGIPPPAKSRKLGAATKPGETSASRDTVDKSSLGGKLGVPLADLMRPTSIDGYVGQESVIGKNAILRAIFESGNVPSLIFWGPPGCGKTTLARIIARVAHQKLNTKFVQLSATAAGVKDVQEIVKVARNEKIMLKRNTILFIDEIHRFNKLQQDTFLPHVEDGTIVLLGATTENPSFQLNSALLSRCRVIVLEKLQSEEIEQLLRRALERLGAEVKCDSEDGSSNQPDNSRTILVEPDALTTLSQLCDGDARSALNGLELAVHAKRTRPLGEQQAAQKPLTKVKQQQQGEPTTSSNMTVLEHDQQSGTTLDREHRTASSDNNCGREDGHHAGTKSSQRSCVVGVVTVQDVMDSLQRSHLLYDRAGEEHYNIISALHKSMRGSDANASLYWLARMLCAGEDPLYVARRVVRFASEDIGLADPGALNQAVAAFQACQLIGKPECEVILAQAVVYMARAPKSVEVYMAYEKAKRCIATHKGPHPSVPLHLRNAPTALMKRLGYSKGYKYNPKFKGHVEQQYMPDGMVDVDFFEFVTDQEEGT